MYHQLIKSDIDGPTLQTTIPSVDTFPIEEKLPMLPAYLRLKNYSIDDIKDLSDFDGLFSQSYVPDELSIGEEQELFTGLAKAVSDMTSSVTEDKFSNSIKDTDLPESAAARLNTRDILKQKIEDCCDAADSVGEEGTK